MRYIRGEPAADHVLPLLENFEADLSAVGLRSA